MFLHRLIDAAADMEYHGVLKIKENNMMCVSGLGWHRGMEAGFYHVFADRCRGVFVPRHTNMFFGFFVFPGV